MSMYVAHKMITTLYADDGSRKIDTFFTAKGNIGLRKWEVCPHGKGWNCKGDELFESTDSVQRIIDLGENWILREFEG